MRLVRQLGFVLIAASLGNVALPPTFAQTEAVELQLKLQRGEAFYYAFTHSEERLLEVGAQRQRTDYKGQAREALRVVNVEPDGTALIELLHEDSRFTVDGRPQEFSKGPTMITVRPDSKVVQTLWGEEAKTYPFALPSQPVRIGDSWTNQFKLETEGVTAEVTETYSLAGLEGAGEAMVARIRFQAQGTVSQAVFATTGVPGFLILVIGFAGPNVGTVRSSGEIDWLVQSGRILRATRELVIQIQGQTLIGNQTQQVKGTLKSTTRRERLSAESLSPAPVAPEFLIVPGRSIGPLTLDLSVADLRTRLDPHRLVLDSSQSQILSEVGGPDVTMWGGDRGFQSTELGWSNGLVAYLDRSDPSRLIGLGIADRRYRTEKGIGFGSSLGTALLAYGMSPSYVNMAGFQGSVRVMVYNDQGIAFAVTSEKKHAERLESHIEERSRHAPIGTVDWILIFSPGAASKIVAVP